MTSRFEDKKMRRDEGFEFTSYEKIDYNRYQAIAKRHFYEYLRGYITGMRSTSNSRFKDKKWLYI
jgi:hypothetical protein